MRELQARMLKTIHNWERSNEFNELRTAFPTCYCAFMSLSTHRYLEAEPGLLPEQQPQQTLKEKQVKSC